MITISSFDRGYDTSRRNVEARVDGGCWCSLTWGPVDADMGKFVVDATFWCWRFDVKAVDLGRNAFGNSPGPLGALFWNNVST
jgi:hypothetical protein